jgi:hypothetical protein
MEIGGSQMQQRVEHEFDFEDNEVFVGLSESLYRFSIMSGVVGMALVALGISAIVLKAYGGGLIGPAIILLGVIAFAGSLLFLRPRTSLVQITATSGRDVSRLLDVLTFLDQAHSMFRIIIVAFVVARLVSFFIV